MATINKNLSHYDKSKVSASKNMKFGIIVSEWNEEITENLYNGARHTLLDSGVLDKNIVRWDVPGSFELIYGASLMGKALDMDAIIVLGSVIQGETRHFDFICDAVAQGIKDLNINLRTPVILGVLTDNTLQQAKDRSGGKHGNKGVECAVAAIKMAALKIELG